jgi:hypothetical protein
LPLISRHADERCSRSPLTPDGTFASVDRAVPLLGFGSGRLSSKPVVVPSLERGNAAIMLDDIAEGFGPVQPCWLYRCADRSPFAYARGQEFIRYGDHARWARLADDQLFSLRSGACIAYRVGRVYYDAISEEPLYYVPSSFARDELQSGNRGTAHTVMIGSRGLAGRVRPMPAGTGSSATNSG